MRLIKAICIAVSTYSILPVPHFDWNEDNMRVSLCALPLVGLPLGGMLLLWNWICICFGIGPVLFAAIAVSLPVFLTGGIHMDGFCDTTDAISSRREKEQKLEILKDSHLGAFAVIYICVYLLLSFGFYTELFLAKGSIKVVCIGFVLSRSLAVWSAVTIPNARKSGMLAAFQVNLERRITLTVTVCCFLLCIFVMSMVHIASGMISAFLCVLWLLLYRRMAIKHFGGVTGDTTGFFLQVTELLILLGVLLGKMMERMV